MKLGSFCAALSALTLLASPVAIAATADLGLRRSEQLDVRRLDKLSANERSVVRVEWHAAVSGAEEARSLRDMLDNLRRMEVTVSEINRLIRGMPTPTPIVAAVATAPRAAPGNDSLLTLAAGATVCLLALWWLRQRKSARHSAGNAAPPKSPPTIRPVAASAKGSAAAVGEFSAGKFSLEAADPEAVARANASMPPAAGNFPQAPRMPRETNLDPTLELADVMLSMGLAQGAAQALAEYSEANPRQALYHWLKLLDIYRNSGHRHDFKETAEKLRRHFNIQAEDWAIANAGEAPTLESFLRVSEQVQKTWSQPEECLGYLRNLLEDNRDGSRAGFPQPVAEEILLLIEILKDEISGTGQAAAT